MEQLITVQFRPTLQDALEAQSYHRRMAVHPWIRLGLYVISGLLVLIGALGLLRGIGSSMVLLIAGLYYPALRPLERRWQIERAFSKDPDKESGVEWQISDEALKVKTSKWSSDLTWPAITKAFSTRCGFLLYVSDTPLWLPRRGFTESDTLQRVTEIIRAKVSAFNQVD